MGSSAADRAHRFNGQPLLDQPALLGVQVHHTRLPLGLMLAPFDEQRRMGSATTRVIVLPSSAPALQEQVEWDARASPGTASHDSCRTYIRAPYVSPIRTRGWVRLPGFHPVPRPRRRADNQPLFGLRSRWHGRPLGSRRPGRLISARPDRCRSLVGGRERPERRIGRAVWRLQRSLHGAALRAVGDT